MTNRTKYVIIKIQTKGKRYTKMRRMNPYTKARTESAMLRLKERRERLEREKRAKEIEKKVEA